MIAVAFPQLAPAARRAGRIAANHGALSVGHPDVLTQINAVFGTVEPKGGSAKPTGKPFLEACQHSLPSNHS